MSPNRVHPPQMKCLYLDSMEHQTNEEPYLKMYFPRHVIT